MYKCRTITIKKDIEKFDGKKENEIEEKDKGKGKKWRNKKERRMRGKKKWVLSAAPDSAE